MYEANSKTSKCNSEVSKSDGEHNRLLVINEIVAARKTIANSGWAGALSVMPANRACIFMNRLANETGGKLRTLSESPLPTLQVH